MKTIKILQAALLITIVSLAASCSSRTAYYNPPPAVGFSLIVNPAPGLVLRYSNGAYYYRDPRGYIYWRGYDNRYYLDRRYVNGSYSHHQQYNDWRRYHDYRRHR